MAQSTAQEAGERPRAELRQPAVAAWPLPATNECFGVRRVFETGRPWWSMASWCFCLCSLLDWAVLWRSSSYLAGAAGHSVFLTELSVSQDAEALQASREADGPLAGLPRRM